MKILLLVFFSLTNIISLSKSEKLIFVELQSRHGARAPLNLFDGNKDILGEEWPNLGELTGIGKRMEYILGLRNRNRYIINNNFLSKKFDPHEILVYSTAINRTLLSMTSQLQGLYPMSDNNIELLSEDQINLSYPSIDYKCQEIEDEINKLGNITMPNSMNMIPIHMITTFEKKVAVYDHPDCKQIINQTFEKNKKEKESLKEINKKFSEKYSKNLSNFLDIAQDYVYENIDDIEKICDAIIADKVEGKTMSEFIEKTKININELYEECIDIFRISFRDKIYGDDKKEVLLVEESMLLREMIHYMKLRVNADINGEKTEENVSDYSKPKMVIISGHDTTVGAQILFIIEYFKLDKNFYKLPTFSAQVAFEVARADDFNGKLNYSDYYVKFYFNDDLLLNITLDKFFDTIEKNLWNQKQIDNFCSVEIKEGKEDNKIDLYLYLIIGISALILILFIVIIILVIKLNKKEDDDLNSLDSDKLYNDD